MFKANKEKKNVEEWLNQFTIAIARYSNNISDSDGIHREKIVAYSIKKIDSRYYVVVNNEITFHNGEKYQLDLEKEVDAETINDISQVKLETLSHKRHLGKLEEQGYKLEIVNLNNKGNTLIASKDNNLMTGIENEFVNIVIVDKKIPNLEKQ